MPKLAINYVFSCFLIFVSIFSNSVYSQDDACIEESPCLCKLSENRYINISGVVPEGKSYLQTTTGNLTFYFSPCYNVQFPIPATNLTNNNCSEPASLCVYNATDNVMTNLGKVLDHEFSAGLPKELLYNKKAPKAKVYLECISEGTTFLTSLDTTGYALALLSPDACIKHNHPGLSTGSKLLIMFCVIFAIYFIGGALVLRFLRGARGKEMIPNVDFWTSLPYLVKDGFVFLLNGCHPIPVSSAEAYDRI